MEEYSLGTAHFASPAELTEQPETGIELSRGGINANRLPLGKWIDNPDIYMSFKGEGHAVAFAPTRAGKGIGFVLPSLLANNAAISVFVLDPKGENYHLSSSFRRNFGPVYCIDPYRRENRTTTFHAVSVLKKAKRIFDAWGTRQGDVHGVLSATLSSISKAIVIREQNEKNQFFSDAAEMCISAALMITLWQFKDLECPPLSNIRRILSGSAETIEDIGINAQSEYMRIAKGPDRETRKFELPRIGAVMSAASTILEHMKNRDVRSTVLMQLEFLSDPGASLIVDGRATAPSLVVDPDDINSDQTITVYLVIPPAFLSRQSRLLRLLSAIFLNATFERDLISARAGKYHQALFLFDEAGLLSHFEPIIAALCYGAAYGANLFLFFQSLSQIRDIYGKSLSETLLSNCRFRIFFGITDFETAKYLSDSMGYKTVKLETTGSSVSQSGLVHRTYADSTSSSVQAVPLIRPEEILRCGPRQCFILGQGLPPAVVDRICAFDDANFSFAFQAA